MIFSVQTKPKLAKVTNVAEAISVSVWMYAIDVFESAFDREKKTTQKSSKICLIDETLKTLALSSNGELLQ